MFQEKKYIQIGPYLRQTLKFSNWFYNMTTHMAFVCPGSFLIIYCIIATQFACYLSIFLKSCHFSLPNAIALIKTLRFPTSVIFLIVLPSLAYQFPVPQSLHLRLRSHTGASGNILKIYIINILHYLKSLIVNLLKVFG